ncbi:MAG: type 4a pilus biogenesis protein PilO [Ardenticatenaceae bacterium]|nr:type 4a pilus biogenesis protein PilO [Ardenticatenaceae bacterium]
MDVLYDIRDTLRDNLVSVAAIIVLAVVGAGYLIFITTNLFPRWAQHQELAAQVEAAQQSQRQSAQNQNNTAAALPTQISQAQTRLQQTAESFLNESQAASILDNIYQYALLSGVEIANLQALPPTSEDKNTLYDERAFALQVNGPVPQLLDFVGRIQEATLPSVALNNLNIIPSADRTSLTVDLHLYTSPFSPGTVLSETTGIFAETAVPLLTPTPAPNTAALSTQLDTPWAAEDWPTVIDLLQQIMVIEPDNADMKTKLYAAYVNYGYQLAEAGEAEAARAAFAQAVVLQPDGAEALNGLQSVTDTAAAPPANETIHTVQSGDTLFTIAQQYQVSVAAIRTANNLTSNTIFPGQLLIIPQD